MKRQVFKPYQQKQGMLLPPSLEEMIPAMKFLETIQASKYWYLYCFVAFSILEHFNYNAMY